MITKRLGYETSDNRTPNPTFHTLTLSLSGTLVVFVTYLFTYLLNCLLTLVISIKTTKAQTRRNQV